MSERKRIYLCLAHMSDEGIEQKYIKEAFDTNWVVPLGPNVNGFEKDLEEFVNGPSTGSGTARLRPFDGLRDRCFDPSTGSGTAKRVVALSSGTAAVHLGLL